MSVLDTKQITAVILAGGKGRRMDGNDKGLLVFKQRPLIEHILEIITPQVSQVLINANRNQDIYSRYGHPVISDKMSDFQGPLAGFSVAMSHATTTHIITLPCDAPFMTSSYVGRMCDVLKQQQHQPPELVVAHDGTRLQPVHALMPISLKASLDDFLQADDRKIDHWYAHHTFTEVDFSDMPELFHNINTAAQLTKLESVNDD